MQVEPVTLCGNVVELRPLAPGDAPALFNVLDDEEVWRFLTTHRPRGIAGMQTMVTQSLASQQRGEVLPFVIVNRESGEIVGWTRFLDISAEDRHVEIGASAIGRAYWRTAVNTEAKYLLLRHAFETLGCIRVAFKTDLRNERSQRAIERLGAVREGVQRKVRIVKDGYQRSSVLYSIIDDEWPAVKATLEERLGLVQA